MKRFFSILLSICMIVSLCACHSNEKAEKFCTNCGKGISKDIVYCGYCGEKVKSDKENEEKLSNDNLTDNISSTQRKENNVDETSKISKINKHSSNNQTENKIIESNKYYSTTKNINKQTETNTLPISTHFHSYSKKVIAATCTEKGFTIYTCSCGDTYKDNYINPSHNYSNYKCTKCGVIDKSNAYKYLIIWVKENGSADGNYIDFKYRADDYTYSLSYSAKYDSLSIQKYGNYKGEFLMTSLHLDTYFYGSSFDDLEMNGYINPKTFTSNSAISYTQYKGDTNIKSTMAELCRINICDLVEWLEWVLNAYNIGLTIKDLGFTSY